MASTKRLASRKRVIYLSRCVLVLFTFLSGNTLQSRWTIGECLLYFYVDASIDSRIERTQHLPSNNAMPRNALQARSGHKNNSRYQSSVLHRYPQHRLRTIVYFFWKTLASGHFFDAASRYASFVCSSLFHSPRYSRPARACSIVIEGASRSCFKSVSFCAFVLLSSKNRTWYADCKCDGLSECFSCHSAFKAFKSASAGTNVRMDSMALERAGGRSLASFTGGC